MIAQITRRVLLAICSSVFLLLLIAGAQAGTAAAA
ncbi:MAG: hypothetical protein BWY80_00318 [Firmicutes bacterium ADurb.Bin456]|nr:MAG: hypothetical protein BWY80_00318 [Firmicutes bacterium ADurb.Bin456]